MSLFKVRDIWSLDLEELQRHSSATGPSPSPTSDTSSDIEDARGQFVASIGQFNCVSGSQDTLVCGDLRGHIYLIQVPESDQRKHIASNSAQRGAQSPPASSAFDLAERQLLAAHDLGEPLVSLKCGLFTSALKQTIAALTYDKLLLLQVKARQVDLMSAPNPGEDVETRGTPPSAPPRLDTSLLSHELEVLVELNLLAGQFAQELLVLETTASRVGVLESDLDSASPTASRENDTSASKFKRTSKQVVQQLQLPQRDKILVQYADQFLFTLVDGKKVTGHFSVASAPPADVVELTPTKGHDDDPIGRQQRATELRLRQMERAAGRMPAAHLVSSATGGGKLSSSLVLAFSDYRLHSVPLERLASLAKQSVMRRVALDLLSAKNLVATASRDATALSSTTTEDHHQRRAQRVGELIQVDLEAASEWSRELLGLPLAMQGLSRRCRPAAAAAAPHTGHISSSPTPGSHFIRGQLLVMSRYSLDLFEATAGAHLWSQRFETPLICMHAYTLAAAAHSDSSNGNAADYPNRASKGGTKTTKTTFTSTQRTTDTETKSADRARGDCFGDKIIALLCSDNLSDDKSNLVVMSDDCVSWSALLNAKPLLLARLNLRHMAGLLVTLDLRQGSQLVVSYLGTNHQLATTSTEPGDDESKQDTDSQVVSKIVELERLDETLAGAAAAAEGRRGASALAREDLRERLLVTNTLEAANSSLVSSSSSLMGVEVSTSIQLDPGATGVVLHNISLTLEFDDLLQCNLLQAPSDGPSGASHKPLPAVRQPRAARPGLASVKLGSCWPDRREPLRVVCVFSLLAAPDGSSRGWRRALAGGGGGVGVAAMDDLAASESSMAALAEQARNAAHLLPRTLRVRQHLDYSETHSGPLHQEREFLLPLSMLTRLAHIDYTSGQGQELDDVLGNLAQQQQQYKATSSGGGLFSDFFLTPGHCDFMALLGEIVEADLLCRGGRRVATSGTSGSEEEQKRVAQVETLESINLLAQSLDCRLRFMSPTPGANSFARQSSEELTRPVMVSLALRLRANNLTAIHGQGRGTETTEESEEQIVWVHLCDYSPLNRSHIVEEFVARHSRDWKRKLESGASEMNICQQGAAGTCQVVISVECEQALPIVLIMDHLIGRVRHLGGAADARLSMNLVAAVPETLQRPLDFLDRGSHLAMSSKLHDTLENLASVHKKEHRQKIKQLRDELVQEYCKFQVVSRTSLSLAKRLPSLPEEMGAQVGAVTNLVKLYHQKLLGVLNEMEQLKRLDYEYSKLPCLKVLKNESSRPPVVELSSNPVLGSGFNPIID